MAARVRLRRVKGLVCPLRSQEGESTFCKTVNGVYVRILRDKTGLEETGDWDKHVTKLTQKDKENKNSVRR